MNKAFFSLLFLGALSGSLHASSPIIIDITTRPEGVRYFLNNAAMTPDAIQSFLRGVVEQFGQPEGVNGVFVCPDAQTPTLTVFDLMRRIKDSGVQRWQLVGALISDSPNSLSEVLDITSDIFKSTKVPFMRTNPASK